MANRGFIERWHKRSRGLSCDHEFASNTYSGLHLWAKLSKWAGTTDRLPVIKALETGSPYDGPSGKITIDRRPTM